MSKLKIALSILALVVISAGSVTTFGNWQVPPAVAEFLMGAGVLLAWLGYQPWAIPPQVSRVFGALSVMAGGFVTSHAAAWGDGHRHIWLVVIAFAGALLGILARGPQPKAAVVTTPVEPR